MPLSRGAIAGVAGISLLAAGAVVAYLVLSKPAGGGGGGGGGTQTTLTASSPASSLVDVPFTVTAVLEANGAPVSGETVVFSQYLNGTFVGQHTTTTDSSGQATDTIITADTGEWTFIANFNGDSSRGLLPSTSNTTTTNVYSTHGV